MKVDGAIFVNSSEFGEAVTYIERSTNGEPKAINALVDPSFDTETESLVDTRENVVIQNDATLGILDPKPGDEITIRGRRCRVFDVIQNPDGHHELIVEVGKAT
jgi:hypothetical protein